MMVLREFSNNRWVRWMFEDRTSGQLVIAQFPNAPLWVFLASAAARVILQPTGIAASALEIVGSVALFVWAVMEIVQGVNPARRLLGAVVLIAVTVGAAGRYL